MRRLILLLVLALVGCRAAKPLPRHVAYWTWGDHLSVSESNRGHLRALDCQNLFVHAGTISFDGDQYTMTLPCTIDAAPEQPVDLVLNFDSGAIRHFEEVEPASVAQAIATMFADRKRQATQVGAKVRGLQVDFDCPTRLLGRYAQMAKELRRLIGKDRLSITGLATWLDSNELGDLLKEVDFWCPQFYEGAMPKQVDEWVPVGNLSTLEASTKKLERWGTPYYVGIPAYGQSLIYGPGGKLEGSRRMPLGQAVQTPSLEFTDRRLKENEWRIEFVGSAKLAPDSGKGHRLVYRMPTAQRVKQFSDSVRAHAGPHCLGVAIFRLPLGPDDTDAVDLQSIRLAMEGKPNPPRLELQTARKGSPWDLIEGQESGSAKSAWTLRFRNVGGPSVAGPNSVTATLYFESGSLTLQSGGTPFMGSPSSIGRVSESRADGLVFSTGIMAAGAEWEVGPLVFSGKKPIRVVWKALGLDNQSTSGELTVRSGQ